MVNVGEVVQDFQSIASSGFLDCQPPAGQTWLIMNVGSSEIVGSTPNTIPNLALYFKNGTNYAYISDGGSINIYMRRPILVSNTTFLSIKNTAGGNANLVYSGIRIK